MKPRTKLEKEVTWLSSHLLPPSMEQIEEAQQHLFTPKAYYTKKHGWHCMECGGQFRVAFQEGNGVRCPHCGKIVIPEWTRKYRETERKHYMLMQTIFHDGKEFVVQRLFQMRKHLSKYSTPTFSMFEIAEYYTVEGVQICLGIPLQMFGSWSYSSEMTIKKPQKRATYYGGSYRSYRFEPDYVCVESVAPTLQRNGFQGSYEEWIPQEFVRLLMCEPEAEKLYKLDHRLIDYYEENIFNQARIAKRHHYQIDDLNMWVDAIKLLRRLDMDDRNPKHICPDNLNEWHDRLLKRRNQIMERERIERERAAVRRRLADEKNICEEYVKRIARYLQFKVQDELIEIAPIPTVEAVADEGIAMHHCVYQCGYYKDPNVLLLSAKDRLGNRVETIEVNLKKFQVAQSRGKCNQNTEHHERILALMKNGMKQIRKMKAQKINIKAA